MSRSRREFLTNVGSGMLIASVGPSLALDMGLASAQAVEAPARLSFGKWNALVDLMQETAPDKLQPLLIEKLQSGTELRELVSAAAMANARALGGHNYDGYHTFMALSPALDMSRELPDNAKALPVLKVLYRNASVIQRSGMAKKDQLQDLEAMSQATGEVFRNFAHDADITKADQAFMGLSKQNTAEAYNELQQLIQDEVDVHRVVLAWRAWSMLDITGPDQATTFLRQSVHYCVEAERRAKERKYQPSPVRKLLPKLMDQYKLAGKTPGTRQADDAWIEKLSLVVYGKSRDQAADAVAAALAEGFSPDAVAEAIALAANRLILGDPGRAQANGTKEKFSVHGDSVGVHASDAANAWRHIARVSNARNTFASLIVGAYHTAGQAGNQLKEQYPLAANLEKVNGKDVPSLLKELDDAIQGKQQAMAAAIAQRIGEAGGRVRGVLDVLLKYVISEDGALHAEKYYRTATEEFHMMRAAFKWRQMVALARVTASEYGLPAPGYADARKLLKV